MMTVDFQVGAHAVGYPNNVLAQRQGEHVYSVQLTTDADNGNLVAIGDWDRMDVFKEAAVTDFEGKIVEQMSDGNWLVLVTDPGDACLVYQKPLTPYEAPASLRAESAMFNKAGSVVRCYGLHKHDRFEVSAAGFSGTPAKGKCITGVTGKKLVVGA